MNDRANKWHPWKGKTAGAAKETRQQLRATLRSDAYVEVTAQYGGEDHATRRALGLTLGNRRFRRRRNLPDIERTVPPRNRWERRRVMFPLPEPEVIARGAQ
jgi:hypothetical protein